MLKLLRLLQDYGAKPCHEQRLLRLWSTGLALDKPPTRPEHHFPARLASNLAVIAAQLNEIGQVTLEQQACDGTIRWLIGLCDQQTIETVLLPRDGLCVSTQVGCAVGCQFCMTGRSGLLRQLRSAEILAQVALARRRRTVRKVVFMGMGEPAHNLENVLEAIDLLGTLGGIAHKNLVFSTVGDLRTFERLAARTVKPALALSLHTTDAARRAQLLPRAPRIEPAELVRLAQNYAQLTGYPVQYQWTLMAGVNDSERDVDAIAALLAGQYAVMNLIPFNAIEGSHFSRPSSAHAQAMAASLRARGVLTKLRQSAGQQIQAGCGQLRSRTIGLKALTPSV